MSLPQTELLHLIEDPNRIREMSIDELQTIAADIRKVILGVLPKTGGHLASNLGVVELTLALHHVYQFPQDQLIFDVGHQIYPHKMITNRLNDFPNLRQKDGLSGFPNPWESEYDPFYTGHAGTAISMALGMARGYHALNLPNRVVSVVGDGSFCGLSFEALNHCGSLKQPMVVILNDNKMAISPTVGAFSHYLNRLRSDHNYHHVMEEIKKSIHNLPIVGEPLEHMGEKVVTMLRNNLVPGQFFTAMGFKYYGPIDGHDFEELITMIRNVRDIQSPCLLHIKTQKGKGMPEAENDPINFYAYSKPAKNPSKGPKLPSYSQVMAEALTAESAKNDKIIAITAAMAVGTKIEKFMQDNPDRSVDTGIAESHAVTLAGGMNKVGMKPVVLIYSTFLQRSYDNIMHDVNLQKDASVVFALDRAGIVGDDGPTHHGVFDIAYLRHLPRMILIAPRDAEELKMMFTWAVQQKESVAIRYPRGSAPELGIEKKRPEIEMGVPEILEQGEKVAILAYGAEVEHALEANRILREKGLSPTIVNLRFAKPLAMDHLAPILSEHEIIVTVEDHALMGGVGSALLEEINAAGLQTGKVLRLGIPDEFVTFADRSEILEDLELDGEGIARRVLKEIPVPQTVPAT